MFHHLTASFILSTISVIEHQVKSGMGTYAGAARRRVNLVTVLLLPPSGHHPGRRQARYAHILDRTPPDATVKPVTPPR